MTDNLHEKNRIGVYLPIFIIGVITTVGLRIWACVKDLNIESGYFTDNTLITIANIVTAVFVGVLMLHSLSHTRNDSEPRICFDGAATYIPLGALAVAVILLSVEITKECIAVLAGGNGISEPVQFTVKVLCALCGFASIGTFLLDILIERIESQLRAAFSLATVMFLALYAVNVYFSDALAVNNQQKILTELGFIFAAMFFLYETRISLGRQKWHSYVAFGLAASLLLAYTGIPTAVVYVKDGILLSISETELIAVIILAIFIGARAVSVAFCPEDEFSELADSIMDMEHERLKKDENNASRACINKNVENADEDAKIADENAGENVDENAVENLESASENSENAEGNTSENLESAGENPENADGNSSENLGENPEK